MSEGSHCEDPNGVQGAIEVSLPLPGSSKTVPQATSHLPTEAAPPTQPLPFQFPGSGMFLTFPGPTQATSGATQATSGVPTPTLPYPIPEFDPFSMGFKQGMGGMAYWPIPSFGA